MEKLFEIYVNITDSLAVKGKSCEVNMVSFNGKACGKYFNGQVLGSGTDTQFAYKNGRVLLSARYLLQGTDISGQSCRIFIENNGSFEDGFTPRLITDSKALSEFEDTTLYSKITSTENELTVAVFKK